MTPIFMKKTPKYLYYLVVKFSQWGADKEGGRKTVYFPIEFSKACLNVQVTKYAGSDAPGSHTYTLTSFILEHADNREYYSHWIAVGL